MRTPREKTEASGKDPYRPRAAAPGNDPAFVERENPRAAKRGEDAPRVREQEMGE